jgi:hypothetical protein
MTTNCHYTKLNYGKEYRESAEWADDEEQQEVRGTDREGRE